MRRVIFVVAIAMMISSRMASAEIDGQRDFLKSDTDKDVFSIVTAPGEDASRQMRISWSVDTLISESYIQYRKVSDKKGKHVHIVKPQQYERCDVFYGKSSKREDNTNFVEDARFIKCGAELDGLKPDTEYEYEVVSSNGKAYGPYYFKTAGAKKWSCCIISDFHSYPPLGNRLKSAMSMIETVKNYDSEMDWILHVGDVCAWGGSYSFWKRLYQEKVFKDYFWAGVNGNHDNMSRTYELSNQYFRNTSYYPENGYEGEKGVCYHFRYGNALFIMLNNESMHSDSDLAKAQKWVKEVVTNEKAKKNAPKYVIVCEHYQWFFGDSGKASQYARWCTLFDELGVDLAIAGNNHIYARTGVLYEGAKTDGKKGTMYLQTTSSDCERGRDAGTLSANEELIEYTYAEGQRTVTAISMQVDNKGISLSLLNREGHLIDKAYVRAKTKNTPSRERK